MNPWQHARAYATPEMVKIRNAKRGVCVDEDCDLSGGYAHVGPCEPCRCGLRHAIDECPDEPRAADPRFRLG